MQSQILFVISCILQCLLVNGQSAAAEQTDEYALVIDAGSSGSRIHVYKYSWNPKSPDISFPKIELPDKKFKITPGLSSFASHPQVDRQKKLSFIPCMVKRLDGRTLEDPLKD
jgi:hypothetical protein